MTRIFCAVDTTDLAKALLLSKQMQQAGCGIKLGMEFFYAHGPAGVAAIKKEHPGLPLFLDLKLKDIPTTVRKAFAALLPLQPDYMTLHATGGMEMMRASAETLREEAAKQNLKVPKLLGVTILTSMDENELQETGMRDQPMTDLVVSLAALAKKSGMAGVVSSGHEITAIRAACGDDFVLMVPGIRPVEAGAQDQKRVMSPSGAMHAGATHLVIGRPITEAENPAEAAMAILGSIS